MPSATEAPTVALSFANNFWGKDDAGVGPLLDRMASAKQTSDELRSFYGARASIEDEYARKLLGLSRKSLGSHEMGSLKASLDTVRGELDSMAKQHANIAAQMKSELEEPLAAFAGGMKERRKIIQNTVEKLLKSKIQQTNSVNKTRDRYEQDCLRIKGYLAQGHMVMGQEERKNKAKLEKTQISLASSNAEYEQAVKALEDTTARWNREWKAAADKFQDLEEERLDFSKSSLWTFANLASTVCVSDDASCEKIRLSLEKMDVENDIIHFINEKGTGQEIPDPPKYINFCRGDIDDHHSEASDEDNYSVAQFPRSINPAFRSSSPQPSTYESHHDPNSALARDLSHQEPAEPMPAEYAADMGPPSGHGHPPQPLQSSRQSSHQSNHQNNPHHQYNPVLPPQNGHPQAAPRQQNGYPLTVAHPTRHSMDMPRQNNYPHGHPASMSHQNSYPSELTYRDDRQAAAMAPQDPYSSLDRRAAHPNQQYDASQFAAVPHDPYPMDGMTMLCRTDGTNPAATHQAPSRYGGTRPSATEPLASSRGSASNPVNNSDVPARLEAAAAMDSNVPPRFDVIKSPVAAPALPTLHSETNARNSINMAARYESAATTANSSMASRFDIVKSPTAPSVLSGRQDGANSSGGSGITVRIKDRSSASNTKVPSRYDLVKSPGITLDDPPPIAGLNTATSSAVSSRIEAVNSATSSMVSAADDRSEISNPTSFSSQEPPSGKTSPVKLEPAVVEPAEPEKRVLKKKSGFFQNHSPFRRKSTKDVSKEARPSTRNTWGPVGSQASSSPAPITIPDTRRPYAYKPEPRSIAKERTASPDPIDANATLALNVGQNVFPVANTDKRNQSADTKKQASEELDPIALALAELKGAVDTKQSTSRISADRYHGITTPIPDRTQEQTRTQTREQPVEREINRPMERAVERPIERPVERPVQRPVKQPTPERPVERPVERPAERKERAQERTPLFTRPVPAPRAESEAGSATRGTPPPSYDTPVQRLGVPPPAVTAKAMQESSRKYTGQTRQMLNQSRPASVYNNSTPSRPATRQADVPRAASPAPPRSVSPRPGTRAAETRPGTRQAQRSASPNPYARNQHASSPQPGMTPKRAPEQQDYYRQSSPGGAGMHSRTASPAPYRSDYDRPVSRGGGGGGGMAIQLAPVNSAGSVYGSVRSRGSGGGRPGTSSSGRAMSFHEASQQGVADPSRQYTPEGRAILHYARAQFMYQAAIPEELGFSKGDILAVLRHQDDGWWEAEIHSGPDAGRGGLVPSNYLQPC
ncbi:hypothetical protein F4777DRAFT_571211 [Nemania sp. FL0916]|nr:hypothetical protein F4777DRAFT_571211 [Nemania sp. FL0916]